MGQLNDILPSLISTFIRSKALIPSSGSGIGPLTSIASTLLRTQEPISSRFSQKSVIGYLVPSAVDAVDVAEDASKFTPSLPAASRGNATTRAWCRGAPGMTIRCRHNDLEPKMAGHDWPVRLHHGKDESRADAEQELPRAR